MGYSRLRTWIWLCAVLSGLCAVLPLPLVQSLVSFIAGRFSAILGAILCTPRMDITLKIFQCDGVRRAGPSWLLPGRTFGFWATLDIPLALCYTTHVVVEYPPITRTALPLRGSFKRSESALARRGGGAALGAGGLPIQQRQRRGRATPPDARAAPFNPSTT